MMTTAERYKQIIAWFQANMPVAESELRYDNPYQLLVAVILSAQCTDKRVNMTTPALFDRFPTAQVMADADPEEIFPYIKSISYPNNKAKNLSGMARMLCKEFGGVVPSDIDELQRLPGVGRKTANVIGIVIFNESVMPVDTHVFRVADRLGLSTGAKTPLQTELQLTAGFPAELLPLAHHWLILHGRYVCTARKPHCEACGLTPWCRYYAAQQKQQQKQQQKAPARTTPETAANTSAKSTAKAPAKVAAKAPAQKTTKATVKAGAKTVAKATAKTAPKTAPKATANTTAKTPPKKSAKRGSKLTEK